MSYDLRMFRRVVVVRYEMPLYTPVAIQVQAHDLIEAGRFGRALWVLWRRAQHRLHNAVKAAKVLRSGEVLPDFPMPGKEPLEVRAARLRDSGRRKEALFIVRGELSVTAAAAEAFVDQA